MSADEKDAARTDAHPTASSEDAIPVFDAIIEDAVVVDFDEDGIPDHERLDPEGTGPGRASDAGRDAILEADAQQRAEIEGRIAMLQEKRAAAVTRFGNKLYEATREDLYLTSKFPEYYDAITYCDRQLSEANGQLSHLDEKTRERLEALEKDAGSRPGSGTKEDGR